MLGLAEILKQGGKDWIQYFRLISPGTYLLAPYGDASRDYNFNTQGMNKAGQEPAPGGITRKVSKYGPY